MAARDGGRGPDARRAGRVGGVLLTAVLVAGLVGACADDATTSATDRDAASAADVYAGRCAGCHGIEGEGASGPPLAGSVVERYPALDDQITVITEGRNAMPGFGDSLTAEEIESVAAYTRDSL